MNDQGALRKKAKGIIYGQLMTCTRFFSFLNLEGSYDHFTISLELSSH